MPTRDQNAPQPGDLPVTPEGASPLSPPRAVKNVRHRLGPRETLDFPPVANGIDYLVSVVTHLQPDIGGTPRDIKYAVLHLQAAAEVLLKARLSREHWSLVFKDPGRADREKFESGDFDSCGTDATVERLRRIACIDISDNDGKALTALAKDRNRLQHYGLTHSAQAVEARAATVLDFLVRFIDEVLVPNLPGAERGGVLPQIAAVREGLSAIQSFVTERMSRLRGNELKGAEGQTLRCPDCRQLALLAEARGTSTCRFCGGSWEADDLAYALTDAPLGSPFVECPDCYAPTLADAAEFADGRATLYCTTCARRFDRTSLGNCGACGCYWPAAGVIPETGQLLCADCQRRIREEEYEAHWS